MTRFSRCSIFALVSLIPAACATAEQNGPDSANAGASSGTAGQTNAGASGSATMAGASSVGGIGAGGVSSMGGSGAGTSGATVGGGGSGSSGGGMGGSSSGMGGVSNGGAGNGGGGSSSGGAGSGGGGSGGKGGTGGGGSGGTQSGGAGSGGGGNGGSGGNNQTAYCDTHAKSALPYTVNEGFQPSVWEGDTLAITAPTAMPDACAARSAGAVGSCSTWRYTPNAVTPAWAGVLWITKWDPGYTHPPVCLADGATKVTFQARGAAGGEQITVAAAGSAEVPVTLTNAWKQYSISLVGVMYNTTVDGVESGFFWKADPNAGTITFFIDDIQIEK